MFYVVSRMQDRDITPEQYVQWREMAVATIVKLPAGKAQSATDIEAEIEVLMPMAQEEGWLQMEWFLNVTPPTNGQEMEGVETTGEGSNVGGDKRLQGGASAYIGLGTMMQDATDYLGARQRQDYQTWKKGIIARIEKIESDRRWASPVFDE
jgi:origin recognition complex subunit 6